MTAPKKPSLGGRDHRWLEETNKISFMVQNVYRGPEETLKVERVQLLLLGWGLGEGAVSPLNSTKGLHHCQSPPPLCPPRKSIWPLKNPLGSSQSGRCRWEMPLKGIGCWKGSESRPQLPGWP